MKSATTKSATTAIVLAASIFVAANAVAGTDRFALPFNAQIDDVSRQLTSLVKKHKSSSEIGYPATAKVTQIQDYDIIAKTESHYEVSIRYQVVASVDSATFEDIFIVKLEADGRLQIVEMKS